MFTIALRNEPWQWTYKPFTTISYLTDPRTNLYKNYKMRIEKAVSIYHNFLICLNYRLGLMLTSNRKS